MGGIQVIEPGLLTTIQDQGRWGYQKEGIPVSGAMDTLSLQIANLLVSNSRNEACLEITLLGPKLKFDTDTTIAITGANLQPKLNGHPISGWRSIQIEKGSLLEFNQAQQGCRAYLATSGGFKIDEVMESKSTYLRGSIGGYKGRSLEKDDYIPIVGSQVNEPNWYFNQPKYPNTKEIRVVMGPQARMFTEEGIANFFNSQYKVSPASDRMGYRLKGPVIGTKGGSDIISDGIPFGGIQIPSDGSPIILMADRQPTGGYAKIGTVATVDLPQIAQSKPGDILKFKRINISQAQKLYNQLEMVLVSLDRYRTKDFS